MYSPKSVLSAKKNSVLTEKLLAGGPEVGNRVMARSLTDRAAEMTNRRLAPLRKESVRGATASSPGVARVRPAPDRCEQPTSPRY